MSVTYFDETMVATLKGVFFLVLPEAVLLLFACVLFLGATLRFRSRDLWGGVALVGLIVSALVVYLHRDQQLAHVSATVSTIWPDSLAWLTRWIALVGGVLLVLLSWGEVTEDIAGEFFGCILLIVAGTSLVGAANELITLFLALELISIPTYILLYLPRVDRLAQESAVKYFLLSIFSSSLLLFGFSYLYGLTGTTNIPAILQALGGVDASAAPALALVAVVMVVAGLGFRITAVPFHFYAPDVYQGSATCVAALLAFIPKVAGFAALIRLLGFAGVYSGSLSLNMQVPLLLWILAAITMTLGNVLALWQDNVQRLLAYSSVANAGYMLIGLTVGSELSRTLDVESGVAALLFYLVAYGAMTLGAFGVVALLNSTGRRIEDVDDLAGLGRSHPFLAALMALFLFSMIGLPLTAGFAGKFLLFMSALAAPSGLPGQDSGALYGILAIIGAVNAAIAAYYYLRIVGVMYLRNAIKPLAQPSNLPGLAAILGCAVLTIWFGVAPGSLLKLARNSVAEETPRPAAVAALDR